MWCKHCHQDVPAVGSRSIPSVCSRCQQAFDARETGVQIVAAHDEDRATPFERILDVEADRRVQALGRSIRRPLAGTPAIRPGETLWLDLPPSTSDQQRQGVSLRRLRDEEVTPARVQWGAWLATTFGLGLAAGGAILLGMALWGSMPEYWTWGVGTVLTGQALLAAGLIWMLGCLWKTTRSAANRLATCEQQLAAVNRSNEALVGQRVAGASAFYAELVRGASPTTLMSSLQGQMAHLASRMYQDR